MKGGTWAGPGAPSGTVSQPERSGPFEHPQQHQQPSTGGVREATEQQAADQGPDDPRGDAAWRPPSRARRIGSGVLDLCPFPPQDGENRVTFQQIGPVLGQQQPTSSGSSGGVIGRLGRHQGEEGVEAGAVGVGGIELESGGEQSCAAEKSNSLPLAFSCLSLAFSCYGLRPTSSTAARSRS